MTRALAGRAFVAVALFALGAVAALLVTGTGGGDRVRPAGKVEIGFAQDMIVHHGQAVTLAQAALGGGAGDAVSQLATGMQLAQLREIGRLEGFLALWDAPHIGEGRPMAWMNAEGHAHGGTATMPGLATTDEVNALGELEGAALETRFLQLMIRHHQGGLLMADAVVGLTTDPDVRAFAVRMATEQRQEAATMTGLLAALGAEPLPSPT
ncbi:uncharacterized protein (DUF305 family) [Actinocorallia herbida]|uniref:Uncharacterized protein (DUF305 family) n=1 Tax=Actinocorallia herbida TaxID=58109 RepID=A0A3N1CYD9_9ACTN|nr:DUF305 domain-containing protein [Actinocorallia herbida]ROO86307.1 uncharacterized protein (DUF305 family) [Actinocorallia herbida]